MSESTGQKLSRARIAKGVSVEEVAHATKLRPDKILALESDDYSRFANNAYVKGFLQIYGRYLGVDVRAVVKSLDSPGLVSISDYQYLNNAPAPKTEHVVLRRQAGRPSIMPLVVFMLLCVLVGGGVYLYVNAQRLGNLDDASRSGAGGEPSAKADAPAIPAATPVPVKRAEPVAEAKAQPEIASAEPTPTPAPVSIESDREFIAKASPSNESGANGTINEVLLEPVKKTWVKVRRDDPKSSPIFEDYLYTNAPPLKLRGARLFIELRDEGAVTIRKNGAAFAFEGSDVTIQ